jgi:heme-degrading monooxygenase HmoA
MFAGVTSFEGDPARIDEGTRYYREHVVAWAKQIPGYKGALSLVERDSGKTVSMTFWVSEQALKESEAAANRLRSEGQQNLGLSAPTVERYEVMVNELSN